MRDKFSNEPRGFAFVTFSDISGASGALSHSNHTLMGKKIEIKKALPKGEISRQVRHKKLFVGGIEPSVNEDELSEYFSKFGNVKLVQIIKDKTTGRSRNFGFVTLEEMESVQNALEHKPHVLKDREMEVKPAEPKRSFKMNNYNPYIHYGSQFYYVPPNSFYPHEWNNFYVGNMAFEPFTLPNFLNHEENNLTDVELLSKEVDKLNMWI